jgi:hypothetical protein
MTETVAFLLKDLVLMAVSFYLLRQDLIRVVQASGAPAVKDAERLQSNPSPSGAR